MKIFNISIIQTFFSLIAIGVFIYGLRIEESIALQIVISIGIVFFVVVSILDMNYFIMLEDKIIVIHLYNIVIIPLKDISRIEEYTVVPSSKSESNNMYRFLYVKRRNGKKNRIAFSNEQNFQNVKSMISNRTDLPIKDYNISMRNQRKKNKIDPRLKSYAKKHQGDRTDLYQDLIQAASSKMLIRKYDVLIGAKIIRRNYEVFQGFPRMAVTLMYQGITIIYIFDKDGIQVKALELSHDLMYNNGEKAPYLKFRTIDDVYHYVKKAIQYYYHHIDKMYDVQRSKKQERY